MARTELTKLLIIMIIIFILCLPEFFILYRVSKVKFSCLPYRSCERENQVREGEEDQTGDAEVRRKDMCGPFPEDEKWMEACAEGESQSNMTGPASGSGRGSDNPLMSWFICETDTDMAELQLNMSSSAVKDQLEMSVELQLEDAESFIITLYGRSNHSSLHLYPPEEEEEEEKEKEGEVKKMKSNDEGQREAFYCCPPFLPTLESANHSPCLLWLANQTVLTAIAKEKLPWKRTLRDEWRCVFRVLWLILLCVVLLTVVAIVLGQINWRRCCCKKPKMPPLNYDLADQPSNDGEKHRETITPKGMNLHKYGFQSGLSPIQEVDILEDIETLLDGTADHCYTANLHHRCHPSTSSFSEE